MTKLGRVELSVATKAAKILGLNVAVVDFLHSKTGSKNLEINSSPGLQGIEKASGADVAHRIVQFIEKNARPRIKHRIRQRNAKPPAIALELYYH